MGENVRVSIFGQSHGDMIGAVVDGFPVGEPIDQEALQRFMDRRAPGKQKTATARREPDRPRIVSGIASGVTCGAPLCVVIENTDTRSHDYSDLADLPRPGHADYTAHVRYGGHQDVRGGGHFSGRLTAPLCAAGGMALQMLARRGIRIGAHVLSVGDARDIPITEDNMMDAQRAAFPALSEDAARAMQEVILSAKHEGDSVGGIVECMVTGFPVGIGDPMFGGIENKLAAALFGIPAVRGVEFGAGFAAASMRGSSHNDPYDILSHADGHASVTTQGNHHGGILGGISSGMPIVFRIAIKPTPSIAMAQQTVRLSTMQSAELSVRGRHDPCIAPRAVPCVEAVAALVLLDLYEGRRRA